jgi:hypothetical protein
MIEQILLGALAAGIIAGLALVGRGGPENSLIGLNAATVCAVTALLVLDAHIPFSGDIAYYLVLPGILGAAVAAIIMGEALK